MFPQPADLMRLQQQQPPGMASPYQMLLQREDDYRLREAEMKRASSSAARPPSRSRAPPAATHPPSAGNKGGKGVRASPEMGRTTTSYHPPSEASRDAHKGQTGGSSTQSGLPSSANAAHGSGNYNLGPASVAAAPPILAPWTPPILQATSSASFLPPPPPAPTSLQLTPITSLTMTHTTTSTVSAVASQFRPVRLLFCVPRDLPRLSALLNPPALLHLSTSASTAVEARASQV
jgi:hypothetical protein